MSNHKTENQLNFLEENLGVINRRIEDACLRAGRPAGEITLIAVSKTHPKTLVQAVLKLGVTHFGENRTNEIKEKELEWPAKWKGGSINWHFIGSLQRKNAKFIAEHADLFHGLDSLKLVEALNRRAGTLNRVLPCLIQVNVSGESTKSGIKPEELSSFVESTKSYANIAVVGLMGMAAYSDNVESSRPAFKLLNDLFDQQNSGFHNTAKMTILSMGMSNDFEIAIEEGATHIRVGTAIFGNRNYKLK